MFQKPLAESSLPQGKIIQFYFRSLSMNLSIILCDEVINEILHLSGK